MRSRIRSSDGNFASGFNDPRSKEDTGDGFLMRHGFAVAWSGRDGELLPGNNRLRLAPPITVADGTKSLTS